MVAEGSLYGCLAIALGQNFRVTVVCGVSYSVMDREPRGDLDHWTR